MHFGGGTSAVGTQPEPQARATVALSLDTLDLIGSRAACPVALANAPLQCYAHVTPVVNSFNGVPGRGRRRAGGGGGAGSGEAEGSASAEAQPSQGIVHGRAQLRPSEWVLQRSA
jgi:hypothetical protein